MYLSDMEPVEMPAERARLNALPRIPALAYRREERTFIPMSLGQLFAGLPGNAKSRAPSPVWRGSTTKPVKYEPLPKARAVKLWHKARRYERETRRPGRQDGAIGRNGLAVLHTLLFDFIDNRTGRLDPSHAAIARMACISVRSVRRGLVALKAAGLVNWLRRCVEKMVDGRFTLEQETNAYAVLPPSQWLGGEVICPEPPPAPPPEAGSWGDHSPLPDAITTALQDSQAGGGHSALLTGLEADPTDSLAMVLARYGKRIHEAQKVGNG